MVVKAQDYATTGTLATLLKQYSISVEDECILPKKDDWPESYNNIFEDLQNLTANTPVPKDCGFNNAKDRAEAFFASFKEELSAKDEASSETRLYGVIQSELSKILINALQEKRSEGCMITTKSFEVRTNENIWYSQGDLRTKLKTRPPHLTYGLAENADLKELLDHYQHGPSEKPSEKSRCHPFRPTASPAYFPFLFFESDEKRRWRTWLAIQDQYTFPIQECLLLQEELRQKLDDKNKSLVHPFVWTVSYCAREIKIGVGFSVGESFITGHVWSTRLDTVEEAHKLITIIDYIGEWARDYCSNVFKALQTLKGPEESEFLQLVISALFPSHSLKCESPCCATEKGMFQAVLAEIRRLLDVDAKYKALSNLVQTQT